MLKQNIDKSRNKIETVFNIILVIMMFKVPTMIIANLIGLFCTTQEQYSQIVTQYQYRISLVGILICFAVVHKFTDKNCISSTNDIRLKDIVGYIVQGVVAYVIGTIFISLLIVYFPSYEEINNLFLNEENIFRFIVIVISAPFIEEYIFRGKIQQYLKSIFSTRTSILIQAMIFGSLHGLVLQQIYAFVFGIYLGVVKEREKNFTSTFVIHMVINLIGWGIGVISKV